MAVNIKTKLGDFVNEKKETGRDPNQTKGNTIKSVSTPTNDSDSAWGKRENVSPAGIIRMLTGKDDITDDEQFHMEDGSTLFSFDETLGGKVFYYKGKAYTMPNY